MSPMEDGTEYQQEKDFVECCHVCVEMRTAEEIVRAVFCRIMLAIVKFIQVLDALHPGTGCNDVIASFAVQWRILGTIVPKQ